MSLGRSLQAGFAHDFSRVPVKRSGASKEGDLRLLSCARKVLDTSRSSLTPDAVFRHAISGTGQPIPYRREMEAAFGRRFDNVRAHLGRAPEMRLLDAEAATRGGRIAFRDQHPSRETVAHELTHVVQQDRARARALSGAAPLSHPDEPAEREATRAAANVAREVPPVIEHGVDGTVSRQNRPPSPAAVRPSGPGRAPMIPAELLAEITTTMERADVEDEDSGLRRLGALAVERLGAEGVVALARQAGVPGAERREREVQDPSGGTIHRQAAEAAAATAGTMWWLTLVDGPLPIGDIVFGALVLGAAIAATLAVRRCRCTIRYAPPEIMAMCPPRVYGTGVTMHDCQNVAKFTAPQPCRQYYGHCGWMP